MPFNRVSATDDIPALARIDIENNKSTWKDLVKQKNLISVTCHAHSADCRETADQKEVCPCGRLVRSHSFVGPAKIQAANVTFSRKFISQQNLTVYGQLSNESRVRNIFITTGQAYFSHYSFHRGGTSSLFTLN